MKSLVNTSLFCLLLFWQTAASFAGTISVSPTPANVSVGEIFTLNVFGTDLEDLFTYQFDVLFDPAKLQANAITEGPFLLAGGSTFFIPGTIDNTNGIISFTLNSLIGLIPGVTGNGSLATIEFQALATGSSQVNVDPGTILLLDSNGNDLSTPTFENGTVNVASAPVSTVPEPSTFALLGCSLAAFVGWKLCTR